PEGQQVAPEFLAAHAAWVKGSKEIAGHMLMTMKPEIQRNLEPLHAHEMLKELKALFAQQAEQELLQTTRDFHSCRQEERQSVSSYVLKMKGYIDNLERLGHLVTLGLGVSLILNGLCKEYDGFVQNYNMHSMGKTVNELHAMLKLHEQTLPKSNAPALNAIRAGNGKNKQAYAPKPKIPLPPKRENPVKDYICHECGEIGHWKRNCPHYLAELMKKKKSTTSGAGGSDRGGEYMSQVFLDHLKDHGIIAHRNPLYTSQHNGVSERRNRTLLDMNKVLVARNAEFLENSLISQKASGSLEDLEIIQEEDTHPSLDTSLNHEEDDLEIDEPQSDIIPIRSKWLFKKKTNMDGNVHIYKARLVEKGYTETPWIDYEETFYPVADIRAIRILIAIVAYYDYEIWQMDVKTVFLNGYLNEEVYMEQPEGFVNPKYPNRVCKLKRSIYGLKQASMQLNKRFDDEIKKFGFTQNRDDPCEKLKLSKSQGASTPAEMKRMQNVPYASAVGSIIGDLKRELIGSCYTDVGYLTNVDDLKSQIGYMFVLNGGAVDWKSAKQSIFATSST
nr:zinc finger, CCHC-type [Tanacetum cinerariifolium]